MDIAAVETEILIAGRLVHLLVHVTDDEGRRGTGECWWGVPAHDGQAPDAPVRATATIVETILAPRCIGRDPSRIAELWFDLADDNYRFGDGGMLYCALSGIDLALWDLAGIRNGVPTVELLGGAVHETLPAYASLPPLRSEEALTREIDRARQAGFLATKLHELDPALIEHAVNAADPDLEVMVDVNGHFTPIEASRLATLLESLGVTWFEEPLSPMRDVRRIAEFRASHSVPIAAGENEWSLLDSQRLLESGAVDYFQPEITKIGGLTPGIRHSALAEVHNVAFSPHNFRLGPSLAASIHWGFSSPATSWIEMPWTAEDVEWPSAMTLPTVTDGHIAQPTEPGMSMPTTTAATTRRATSAHIAGGSD